REQAAMEPCLRAVRYQVGKMKVIYDTGESYWVGPVVNVSESGLFIETHHVLPLGSRVVLHPDLPDDEQLPFEVQAEVVRVREAELGSDEIPGLAFQMVDMSEQDIAQFRAFLLNQGVPEREPKSNEIA